MILLALSTPSIHACGVDDGPRYLAPVPRPVLSVGRFSQALLGHSCQAPKVSETRIENLTQKLGGVTWINVDFVNSIIQYNGEPTYLGGATFTNCKFEFGSDPVSKWLLGRVSRPVGPITVASTAMF
jgi:hypothetical protein